MALPIEMIDEILCRLAVKPLLRFRCVSKSWCSLIDSTAFVKKHLKTTLYCNAGLGLMIMKESGDQRFYLASFDSLDDESAVVEIDDPLKSFLYDAQIVGASNGLMCVFKIVRKDFYLLNPTTRKYRKIARLPPEFTSSSSVNHLRGFGYDEVNDDFKVVMIAECYKLGGLIAMVYSLKTNAWTRVQNVPSNIHFTGISCGLFASGSLHWMAIDNQINCGLCASGSLHWMAIDNQINCKDIIVGFDLKLQHFKEVPFPPIEVTCASLNSRNLVNVGEYLCILDINDSYMDVWLMNYPGAGSTWYKAFSMKQQEIPGSFSFTKLVAFSRSGEDLLLQVCTFHTQLAWYNINRKTVKNVGIREIPLQFFSFPYTESLLQLTDDEALQQKPSKDKQKKNTKKKRRDEFLSRGSSLGL